MIITTRTTTTTPICVLTHRGVIVIYPGRKWRRHFRVF